ncbi:MAG: hypothetical protein CM1200mP12_19530 [Gammaproteobacteria bacterium]|nr:MAG: hypothetical protein CM1200mP12_19530 [Gammaproteobacteria bacterium]
MAEDGLIWNMRILIESPFGQKYGYSEEASSAAPGKIAEVITLIDNRLKAQEKRDSRYLLGDALTAADIYWATMSMTVLPVPPGLCRRPAKQRDALVLRIKFKNSSD